MLLSTAGMNVVALQSRKEVALITDMCKRLPLTIGVAGTVIVFNRWSFYQTMNSVATLPHNMVVVLSDHELCRHTDDATQHGDRFQPRMFCVRGMRSCMQTWLCNQH
jgi:hypothetical protein